eukprot:8597657-Heterocapsa_arctica.AAC.1
MELDNRAMLNTKAEPSSGSRASRAEWKGTTPTASLGSSCAKACEELSLATSTTAPSATSS